MSLQDLAFSSDQFCGTARLFPLPNLVVFPHVMQPLHIFEPRYLEMFKEAIADDAFIAMALLNPGWESDYEGRPPIGSTACLCRIATHQQTDEGTCNALLIGMRRITIVRELPPHKRFREAEASIVEDVYPQENAARRPVLQRRLVAAFRKVLPKVPATQESIEELLTDKISLGMLTDIIAYTLKLDQKIKEDLLIQPLPDLRALLLLECLTAAGKTIAKRVGRRDRFPPQFSAN